MNKCEMYYNKFCEDKRLDTRHGQMEFRVTYKYIQEYLARIMEERAYSERSELKLLDIGAGTGRYSVPLSEEGYEVTAIELVKYNLGILKRKKSNVIAMQGNALRLKKLQKDTYDFTLLFGPMYHLLTKEEKLQALSEAKRVTKPGGYIFVAYIMNDYAFLMYAIQENRINECMEKGRLTEDFHTLPDEESLYDFVRLEDIDFFNESVGLTREKIISPDGPANYMRPFVNRLDERGFEALVQYQMATCERLDLIGAGAHTVDILRKAQV